VSAGIKLTRLRWTNLGWRADRTLQWWGKNLSEKDRKLFFKD